MKHLEQALRFRADGCSYCVDTNAIMQILRVPLITKIPMTSPAVRGFCPINGNVISVIDSMKLLNIANKQVNEHDDCARILTIKAGDIVIALLVQEVIENLPVTEDNIEFSESEPSDPVVAIMKASDDIVQVLDIDRLFKKIELPQYLKSQIHDAHHKDTAVVSKAHAMYKKLLFFTMNDELFAIDIDVVQEIIDPIEKYTPIADAPSYALGLFTLREYTVLAIDYRVFFGYKAKENLHNRLIIISHKSRPLGLLVDGIIDIKDVDESLIEMIPDKKDNDKISGITKLQNSLVSVVSTQTIDSLADEMRFTIPKKSFDSISAQFESDNDSKGVTNMELVVFTLGKEEYAFSIDDVEEIIRYTEVTKLSEAPPYVKGIINLRGTVIPVVSLHERLGFNGTIHEDTKILVCKIHDYEVGFLVDNVSEVLEIDESYVASADHKNSLFSHVIIMEGGKRMILKLATEELLERTYIAIFKQGESNG